MIFGLCVHFRVFLSYLEHTVDAWAQGADEGRGSLR